MSLQSRGTALAFVAPSLVCLAIVIGYPLVEAIATSLYDWNLISGSQWWVGIGNFVDILNDPESGQVAIVTIIYTVLSVGIELVLGYLAALVFRAGLVRGLRGFPLLRVLFCLPLFIAPLIWAFYFRNMYSPEFGAINSALSWFGIRPIPWVNDPRLALYSLIVADTWQWTPFMFAIILAGMQTLPQDIMEAARLDGAGEFKVLYLIELPLLRPIILVAVLLRLIDALKNIDLVIIITQGGPGTSTEILNYYAYQTSFQNFEVGRGAALALIVFVVIMLLVLLLLSTMKSRPTERPT